jgi:peptidoglycan/LPS O-acetylase OafA/YrhL
VRIRCPPTLGKIGPFFLSSTSVQTSTRPKHLPALDGVRLLAVGLVILHHITSGTHTSILLHLIGLQRDNGLGPPLFFVLSGALLTTVIIDARNTENRYRNFLLRRVLRIFPLYFGYLAVAAIATWAVKGVLPQNFWVFALFAQNIFPHVAGQTGSVMNTYHLWTIAVQDQFYVIWPLLLWRCKTDKQMRYLCYAGIVLTLLVRIVILHPAITPELMGRSLPARAGTMCLGALIALERREKTFLTPLFLKSLLPLSIITIVWMWYGLDFFAPIGSTVGLALIGFLCAAFIATAMQPSSWITRVLASKFFALGGKKYAFGMYMFHPFLLSLCTQLPMPKAVQLTAFLVSTVVLAGLSYRYYEGPFLHMQVGRSKPPQPVAPPRIATPSFSN